MTPFLALAASLVVIGAIRFLDVIERESKRMILLALLIGALSVIPALVAELASQPLWPGLTGTVIGAPVFEELFKGVGLLLLHRVGRNRFDSLTDYVVYGCAIGIGFELVENILYQWGAVVDAQPVASWVDEFNTRMLASAGSHAFFSAWLGLALWCLNQGRGVAGAAWSAGSAGMSVLLHALNNLAAVMTQLGRDDTITAINRLGTSLAVIGDQITLALFVGLVGVAVLQDVRCLNQFGSEVQSRLIGAAASTDQDRLSLVQDLTNPLNHLLVGSGGRRSRYRRFSRLALSAGRVPAAMQERNLLVDEGAALVLSLSN